MPAEWYACPICSHNFRSDRFITHIYNKHRNQATEIMIPDHLQASITARVPLLFRANLKSTGGSGMCHDFFAVCLTCKTSSGNPVGATGHRENVNEFVKEHLRYGLCKRQWNNVCSFFGVAATTAPPPVAAAAPPTAEAPNNVNPQLNAALQTIKERDAEIQKLKEEIEALKTAFIESSRTRQENTFERECTNVLYYTEKEVDEGACESCTCHSCGDEHCKLCRGHRTNNWDAHNCDECTDTYTCKEHYD